MNYIKNISFLGHVVSSEVVPIDPKKIQAVMEWPRPTIVTEVRLFFGFVSAILEDLFQIFPKVPNH